MKFWDGVTEAAGIAYNDALLKHATLAGMTEPVTEPGYPEPGSYPVRRCLQAILTEEWEHRLFAERDLDLLASRSPR